MILKVIPLSPRKLRIVEKTDKQEEKWDEKKLSATK